MKKNKYIKFLNLIYKDKKRFLKNHFSIILLHLFQLSEKLKENAIVYLINLYGY